MRPILIGMNNPVSSQPGHELYPAPEGCTGHRLWCMIDEASRRAGGPGVFRSEYLRRFERRNLVPTKTFSRHVAMDRANATVEELLGRRRSVVLLGREVQRAFGITIPPLASDLIGGCEWWSVPHPSGRNLWYNDPANCRAVGDLLLRLMETT